MPAAPVKAPAMPALATITGVELVAAGTWKLSTGETTFTPEDLANAVEAAQCPSVGSPILKLGHTDPRFTPGDGEPAVGHVTNMALAADGNKVTGDYAGMPGWLGEVMASAYPKRSIEGAYDFVCQQGHKHPFVITAVALLGVSRPGVGVLNGIDDVAELYGVSASVLELAESHGALIAAAADPGRGWTLAAEGRRGVSATGLTTEDVRRQYYDQQSVSYSMWITEMQLDPPQLIVCDEASDKVYRVPVTIKGGTVTFGDPVEVVVEYADVKAKVAAAKTITAAAGIVRAWDGGAAEKNLGTDPSTSAIKKLYALPGADKSSSKLPHHAVSADGTVGAADDTACSAAIAAINGGRGGLAGVSDADKKKAYSHLAAHLKADGKEAPEFKAGEPDPKAGGPHGPYTGTHSHPHAANGGQGGDATHEHSHTHSGDATHDHVHAGATTRGAEMDFSDEQLAALRARLGKGPDDELTPDEILAAVPEPGKTITASQLPAGTILLDREEWEGAQRQIAEGVAARAQQVRDSRDMHIEAAIAAGKFSVARRGHWERVYDADPEGTRQILAGLTRGVVPVEDIGQPGGPGDEIPDEFAALFPPEPAARG